eukprot:scaffold4879_cov354-Prasinococcus_capsulatus_cf.AAC.10
MGFANRKASAGPRENSGFTNRTCQTAKLSAFGSTFSTYLPSTLLRASLTRRSNMMLAGPQWHRQRRPAGFAGGGARRAFC